MANIPGGQKPGGSRLFIGGLPPNVSNKEVEDVFSKHGKVLDVRINRKFCFVQFEDEPSAQKAIDGENGQSHFGRKLDVQFARAPKYEQRGNPGEEKEPGGGGPIGRDRSPIGGIGRDRGPGGPPMRGRGGFNRGGFNRGGPDGGDRFGNRGGPHSDSPFRGERNFRGQDSPFSKGPNEGPFRDSIFNRPEFTTARDNAFGRGRDSDVGFGERGGPDGHFGQRGESPFGGRSGTGSDGPFGGRGEGGMGGRMPPNDNSFAARPGSDGFGGRPGGDTPFGGGRDSLLGRPPTMEPFSRNEGGSFGGPASGGGGFDGGFPPRRGPGPGGESPFGRDNLNRDGPGVGGGNSVGGGGGGGPDRFGRGPRGDGPFNRSEGGPFNRGGPPNEGGFGARGPLLDSPFSGNRDFRGRDEQPPPRGGPPFRGGEFNGREPVEGSVGGWGESWNNQFPPTQDPEPLATSNEDRANDVEIIVCSKNIIDYGEFIEGKLKSLGFSVDVLFPNEAVPIERVLSNIASRGSLYAIVINPVHQSHWSLTLHVLHGTPQEHRNIPVEDAVALILRNFDLYSKSCKENRPPLAVPEQVRHLLEQIMSAKGLLTSPQYEILIQFFKQEKIKVDPLSATTDASKEAQLQNRILNILNKSDPSAGGGGMPPPTNEPPNKGSTPLLNDPSVQKALDSLMQGDILRKISSNAAPTPPTPPFSRF